MSISLSRRQLKALPSYAKLPLLIYPFGHSMEKILMITQAVIATLLSLLVLVQNKDEGLSATFNANQSFQVTRRGPEKVIFLATIILAALFVVNSLLFVFVK